MKLHGKNFIILDRMTWTFLTIVVVAGLDAFRLLMDRNQFHVVITFKLTMLKKGTTIWFLFGSLVCTILRVGITSNLF